MRRSASAALLLAATLLFVACSGGATPAPDATRDPGGGQPTEPPSETQDPGSGGGGGGGGEVPTIVGGTFTKGSAKIELSGDVSANAELALGLGYGAAGSVVLQFAGDPWFLQIAFSPDGNGFALTGPAVVGGEATDGFCEMSVSRNEASALEGEIRCDGTAGIEGTTVHDDVDVKITFNVQN